MPRYFVSRHPGAIAWAQHQRLNVDAYVAHLHPDCVHSGDVVMGTLPVAMAAQVCARGARYLHLSLQLPPNLRGQELSVEQLHALQAHLQRYHVAALATCDAVTDEN